MEYPDNCTEITQIPTNPVDDKQYCDTHDRILKYDQETKTFIKNGVAQSATIVTQDNDGLVYPELYEKIALVKSELAGTPPQYIKLYPGTDARYYYFTNTNKLIKIKQEDENKIRLEFNKSVFYHRLCSNTCPGPEGDKGDKGRKGDPGDSYGIEPSFAIGTPEITLINNNTILIDKIVLTPIETDISIRIHREGQEIFEILIDPTTKETEIINSTDNEELTIKSLSYNDETEQLLVTIESNVEWTNELFYVLQYGPDGDKGDDGTCIYDIIHTILGDGDIRKYTRPIVSVRFSSDGKIIYLTRGNIFPKKCVAKLSFDTSADGFAQLFTNQPRNGNFLAVRKRLESCKQFVYWQFNGEIVSKDDLFLPQWTPQDDCATGQRWDDVKLEWIPDTDGDWVGVGGDRDGMYPWDILIPSQQDANCDPCAADPSLAPCE